MFGTTLISLLISFSISSVQAVEDIAKSSITQTGACANNRPGIISRLSTEADKMQEKCLVDVYNEYLSKRDEELRQLTDYSNHLNTQLKKVAVKVNRIMVDCGFQAKRKAELVFRCRQLNDERINLSYRIDRLKSWDDEFKKAVENKVAVKDLPAPPCPTTFDLIKIKGLKSYNRKLHLAWENCRKNQN